MPSKRKTKPFVKRHGFVRIKSEHGDTCVVVDQYGQEHKVNIKDIKYRNPSASA